METPRTGDREQLIAEALRQQAAMEQARSPVVRALLAAAGFAALGLGLLGVLLPVLPTTPFVLLAAACFARSSRRFFRWLLSNRAFGHHVAGWRVHRCIPARIKALAIALVVLTIGSSAIWIVPLLHARLLLGVIGLAIVALLLRLPSC
jgi:uncharacterized membrane protein YbaN (DUF454 family)